MAMPWTSLTKETNGVSSRGHVRVLFHELGQILERLWIFYEAMLHGKPVPNSDEVLSQIEVTLRRVSSRPSDRVGAEF
jgi:hypothetical protein